MMNNKIKVSGLTYDPDQKIATVLIDGLQRTHSFHAEAVPTKKEVIEVVKALAKPEQEVVVVDMADEEE